LITAACPKTCNVCDAAQISNGKATISGAVKQLVASLHTKFAENSKRLEKKSGKEQKPPCESNKPGPIKSGPISGGAQNPMNKEKSPAWKHP